MKRHKHYDTIVAWAEGKQIQVKGFQEWFDLKVPPTWNEDQEYRVKPETSLKYRVALWKDVDTIKVIAIQTPEYAKMFEKYNSFIRWVTDWIEVPFED